MTPELQPVNVVYDVNVLVGAVTNGNNRFRSWPSPPPVSDNPFADCVGIINDAAEFALWMSPHVLTNIARVLTEVYKWETDPVETYLAVLVEIADNSEGGVVDPPRTVSDCRDFEDNHILDLAADVGALLIVSDDVDLTSMSPWRGTPILRPRDFTAKADAMRRHQRRRRT